MLWNGMITDGSTATTPTLHTLHSVDIRILGSEEKLTKWC